MNKYWEQYGPYALVTGASSGIGKEFAWQLAAKGFNLVMVARRREILEDIANNIRSKYQVSIRTISLDLSAEDADKELDEQTKDIDIGLVVLNAAAITIGAFLKNRMEDEMALIQVNAIAPMKLAHLFGNRMKARHKGGIIFVSSFAGHSSAPYQANYAASKAYVFSLGQALNYEFKKHGIDVTVLSPGLTNTEGIEHAKQEGVDFAKLPMTMMGTSEVVHLALNALGKKVIIVPGLKNRIIDFMTKYFMPRASSLNMSGKMIEKTLDQRLL